MENINLILLVCLAIPISMMLFVFKGRSRGICGFLLAGMFMCAFSGEINGLILNTNNFDTQYISVNIAPLVEEILKALPVVFIAFLIKPSYQQLVEFSLATGVGFATLENVSILITSGDISFLYALVRAVGAGMMHGICTLAVGISMKYVLEKKILFFSGTLSALSVAVIYHSVFNMLVTSKYMFVAVLLPTFTFLIISVARKISQKNI